MELVDVPHSKCGGATRAGSSPAIGSENPDYISNLDFSVYKITDKLE